MVFFKEIEKINTLVLIFEEFENDRPVGRSFSGDFYRIGEFHSPIL